jgi:XcyI restriction endonuclease
LADLNFVAVVEQYMLRATFFFNQLDVRNFTGLLETSWFDLSKVGPTLNWDDIEKFEIDASSFRKVAQSGNEPARYFCHPNVLITKPSLLLYYRCISTFPQKGLKAVSKVSSIEKIEKGGDCSPEAAVKIARAINSHLSTIYSFGLPEDEKMKGIMYATAGATIEGSWRNAIGSEGERAFRSIFLRAMNSFGELASMTLKNGDILAAADITDALIDEYSPRIVVAIFSNGAIAKFGSEPDVTLIDGNGSIVAGVEIKAGLDPAAALERLGAMFKSFEQIKILSPNAETILLASCITDEVQARLNITKSLSRQYMLNEVVTNKKQSATKLVNVLRGLLGLVPQGR